MSIDRRFARLTSTCVVLLFGAAASGVSAQQAVRVALFKTSGEQSELGPLVAATDPVLQSELGKIAQVSVVAQPALDLPSLQLALDCVGETPSCLSMAAERTGADALVAPTLARTDTALVLSVLLFQPAQASPMRMTTRRFASGTSDEAVLKSVAGLLHELFGIAEPAARPEPEPVPAPTKALPRAAQTPAPAVPAHESPSLVLPVVLGAAGVVLLGTGVLAGVAAKSGEDTYAQVRVNSAADGQRAADRLESAQSRATFANVALVVGGLSLLAGVGVFVVQRIGEARTEPRKTASIRWGIGLGGVAVSSTWN
jgi:hypothetical protein